MIFRNKIKFIVSEAPILYILEETIPPILEETQKTVFLPHQPAFSKLKRL